MSPQTRPYLLLIAILVVQVALTGCALWGGFALDDYAWLEYGSHVAATPGLLLEPGVAGFFRPLVAIDFALEGAAWGLSPLPFHATGLALELLATVVVCRLARALGMPWRGALFAAAVFGWHAAHSETAGWISARGSTMATLLGLLTAIVWVRHGASRRGRLAAVGLFVLALLTKEEAVAVVPCIALLELARCQGRRYRACLLRIWPLVAVLVPYLVLQWHWQADHPLHVNGEFAVVPVRVATGVATRIPELLCNSVSFGVVGSLVCCAVLFGCALVLGGREAGAGFGALTLAAVVLVPTAALSFSGSELRYMHQASAWAAIAAGWWLVAALRDRREAAARVLLVMLAAVLVAGAYRLHRRVRMWDFQELDSAMRVSLFELAPRVRAAGTPLRMRDAPLSRERAGPLVRLVLDDAAAGFRWSDERPAIGWTGERFEWLP